MLEPLFSPLVSFAPFSHFVKARSAPIILNLCVLLGRRGHQGKDNSVAVDKVNDSNE